MGILVDLPRMPFEDYKELSLFKRLACDMITYRTEREFASRCYHIVSDRRDENGEMTEGDRLLARDFRDNMETAIMCESALKRVFRSEYGEPNEELEQFISTIAKTMCESRLEAYGWIKKENKGE